MVRGISQCMESEPLWSSVRRGGDEFRYDPYLLYRYKPGASFWGCTTDANGFLHNGDPTAFDPLHKPAGTFRIFLLGGSTAASYHAGSNTLTIAAQLERKLNQDQELLYRFHAQRFQVANAAVSGYTSTQEFLFLSLELIRYSPDMVILLHGYNEWSYSILRNWKPHGSLRSEELEQGLESVMMLKGSLLQSSRLLRDKIVKRARHVYKYTDVLFTQARHKVLRASGGSMGKYDDERRTVRSPINQASIEIYHDNLRNVAALCRGRGLRCLLILQPTFGIGKERLSDVERLVLKEHGYALEHKTSYFNKLRALFSELAEQDGPYVRVKDFTEVFRNISDQVYIDFAHYNQLGNQLLAERIRAEL